MKKFNLKGKRSLYISGKMMYRDNEKKAKSKPKAINFNLH